MGKTTRANKSIENEDEQMEDRVGVNLMLIEWEGKETDKRSSEEERSKEEEKEHVGEGNEEELSVNVEDSPIQPFEMYFQPEEYNNKLKIATRCFIDDVVKTLGGLEHRLSDAEERWFHEHLSFKHIWHFPIPKIKKYTHKLMAMWMLLLRTIKIEKEKEVWFMVNGVPIRYGIKEHALMSGFNCRNYPLGYMDAGSGDFVKRCFSHLKGKPIQHDDVRDKLLRMDGSERYRDRLKMALLFLLSGVLRAQSKQGPDATPVEPFLLRVVDDLPFCEEFPWGRYTFDHMLVGIKHMMDHFDGTVGNQKQWTIPGFIIPLSLLAFEAIPQLGNMFRENVDFRENVSRGDEKCPRMCKTRFRKGYLNGFSLQEVTEKLGSTQEIDSILPIREEEQSLMDEITEAEDDVDRNDIVVDGWMRCFSKGEGVKFDQREPEPTVPAAETPTNVAVGVGDVMDILKSMNQVINKLVEKVDGIDERLTSIDERLTSVVNEVKEMVNEEVKEVNEEVEEVNEEEVKEEVREKSKVSLKRPNPEAEAGLPLRRSNRSKTITTKDPS